MRGLIIVGLLGQGCARRQLELESYKFAVRPAPERRAGQCCARAIRVALSGVEDASRRTHTFAVQVELRCRRGSRLIRPRDFVVVRDAVGASAGPGPAGVEAPARRLATDEKGLWLDRHGRRQLTVAPGRSRRVWVVFEKVSLARTVATGDGPVAHWPVRLRLRANLPDTQILEVPLADPERGTPQWEAERTRLITNMALGMGIWGGHGYGATGMSTSLSMSLRTWAELDLGLVGLAHVGVAGRRVESGLESEPEAEAKAEAEAYLFMGGGPIVGYTFRPNRFPFFFRPVVGYVIARQGSCLCESTTHSVIAELHFGPRRRPVGYPFRQLDTYFTWSLYLGGMVNLGSFDGPEPSVLGGFLFGASFRLGQ